MWKNIIIAILAIAVIVLTIMILDYASRLKAVEMFLDTLQAVYGG